MIKIRYTGKNVEIINLRSQDKFGKKKMAKRKKQ